MGNKKSTISAQRPKQDNGFIISLLGSGLTGKSTIFKSLKLLKHNNDDQLVSLFSNNVNTIRQNCVYTLIQLISQAQQLGHIDLTNDNISSKIKYITQYKHKFINHINIDLDDYRFKELGKCMKYLWNLDGIQETFRVAQTGRIFAIVDNMDFFLNKIDKIMNKNYKLSTNKEDYLKTNLMTTGINDMQYTDGNANIFTILDVGGTTNERKKWMLLVNSAADINCILYTVSLDHYSKIVCEDKSKNALIESIQVFKSICNNKLITIDNNYSIISIILTKPDSFKFNLKYVSLSVCFGDKYTGRDFNGNIKNKQDFDSNVRMTQIAISIIFKHIKIKIDHDVSKSIASFVRFDKWWLDLCYKDGIQFITKKLLDQNTNTNRKIDVYIINPTVPEEVDKCMDKICAGIIKNNIIV